MGYVLVWFLLVVGQNDQEQLMLGKLYSVLPLTVRRGTQGGNGSRELKGMRLGLAQPVFSLQYLGPPPQGRHRLSNRSIFPIEVPFPQMTLACVKLTKNEPSQST